MATCESENTEGIDQSSFWDGVRHSAWAVLDSLGSLADLYLSQNGIHWDAHRIGWAVSGAFALAVRILLVAMLALADPRYHRQSS